MQESGNIRVIQITLVRSVKFYLLTTFFFIQFCLCALATCAAQANRRKYILFDPRSVAVPFNHLACLYWARRSFYRTNLELICSKKHGNRVQDCSKLLRCQILSLNVASSTSIRCCHTILVLQTSHFGFISKSHFY